MRREFPKRVMVAAFLRANGVCEGKGCTNRLFTGKFEYDHDIPNEMGGEPTLENCVVLCTACHKAKTFKQDIPAIAKSNRVRARHIGAHKSRNPIRGWKLFDGTPVRADQK